MNLTDEQRNFWKLASMDAKQLRERTDALPDSKYKDNFTQALELAMIWLQKAVITENSLRPTPSFDEPPQESEHGRPERPEPEAFREQARLEAGCDSSDFDWRRESP
jgi:hypothetical protein